MSALTLGWSRRVQARIAAAITFAFVICSPAAAQSGPSTESDTPEIISKLFECREIASPDDRLACFDREVAAVVAAQESDEIVIADREQVQRTRRGLFGLQLPNLGLFGGSDDEALNELTATLAGATKLKNGRHIFELEDGARWIETEDVSGFRKFKAGDTIVIKKAALGSFKAKVNGKRAAKVRRLN